MRLEIQLTPSAIGYVRVELGRRQIGKNKHFINRAKDGASLELVCRERVEEEVRVNALRFEPRLRGQAAQDEEDAGAGQRAAARVEEELLPVAALEERATASEVEAKRFGSFPSDRDDSFLAPLADAT